MKRYWKRTAEGKEIKWVTVEVDMPTPWKEIPKEEYDRMAVKKSWWKR